ncbi:hypothetical protein LCGC14_0671570 [marine sediment metagenome]|uniref:Uncharacterized protein n=1 Tax=marine sediment metagenome TaxID=412755 RepID=A0A0F9TYS7_9ZZZZ
MKDARSEKVRIDANRLSNIERGLIVPTVEEKNKIIEVLEYPISLEVNEERATARRDISMKAMKTIKDKTNARDSMECPLCKGVLHYTVAALNGHVHGKCETENCLGWME